MPGPFSYPLPPTAAGGYGRAGAVSRPRFMGPPVASGLGKPRFNPTPVPPQSYPPITTTGGGGAPPFRPPDFNPMPPIGTTGGGIVGAPLPPSPYPTPTSGGGGPVGPPTPAPGPTPTNNPGGAWVDAGYGVGPLSDDPLHAGMQWRPNKPVASNGLGQAGLYGVSR